MSIQQTQRQTLMQIQQFCLIKNISKNQIFSDMFFEFFGLG